MKRRVFIYNTAKTVADVYPKHLDRAREWAGREVMVTNDFRKMLEMKNLDAVEIATPDHWHAIPAVMAAQTDSAVPAGVDWDFYLGPAPMVPFNKNRFVGIYRWSLDYCYGIITDYGAHRRETPRQNRNRKP